MQPFPKRKVTRPKLGDNLADGLVDDLAGPGDGYEEDEEHPERRAHLWVVDVVILFRPYGDGFVLRRLQD